MRDCRKGLGLRNLVKKEDRREFKDSGKLLPQDSAAYLICCISFLKKCFPRTVRSFIHGNRKQNSPILDIELQHAYPRIESMLVIIYFILR